MALPVGGAAPDLPLGWFPRSISRSLVTEGVLQWANHGVRLAERSPDVAGAPPAADPRLPAQQPLPLPRGKQSRPGTIPRFWWSSVRSSVKPAVPFLLQVIFTSPNLQGYFALHKGQVIVVPAQEQLSQVDCVLHPPHDPGLDLERGPDPGDSQPDWVAPPNNLHLACGGGSLDLLLTRFAGQVCLPGEFF